MLDFIFKPKSIALIGASREAHALGYQVLQNIKQHGYRGKIYPVNPKANKILGLACYKSVLEIPGKIDLAVVMVPAQIVNLVVEECGKKKIKGLVIISAGFKEMGGAGVKREEELQGLVKKYGMQLIGPNCLGILNPWLKLNASFAEGLPPKGEIGLISQSGAMAVAILDWAHQSGLGFSKIISIGNKAGLTEIDLLKYLNQDPQTKVIVLYLESLTNGREFMRLADKITNHKPIIVLKPGLSAAAKNAISSHTGSLAGSEETVRTAFRQCGVIRARTAEDVFNYAKGFSWAPLPKNNRIAIITNAGGPGIMAVDALTYINTKLQLAKLSPETQTQLKNCLPAAASVHNPVDLIGDAKAERYKCALNLVLKDPGVDAVLVILTPQSMTEEELTAQYIIKATKHSFKPIIPVFMGGKNVAAARRLFTCNKIAHYNFAEKAIRVLNKMYLAERIKSEVILPTYASQIKKIKFPTDQCQLRTLDCENLLKKYKIPVLASKLYRTKQELAQIKSWPIAMKIASRTIVHKRASGAVQLKLGNLKQAGIAFTEIVSNVKKINPHAEIEGVLVQPMLKLGTEIIIGMKRDAQFGPLIMFGLGGSQVEYLKDVSFRIAPLNKREALKQIQEIKSYPLIKNLDLDFITELLVQVSYLSLEYPQIKELDLNPVMVYDQGGYVIDVRMIIC